MAGSLRHAAPLGERRQVPFRYPILLAACIPFTCAQRAARGGRGATPRTPPTTPSDRPSIGYGPSHAGRFRVVHTTPDVTSCLVTITHTQVTRLTGHTRHMSCHIGTVARAAVFASIDEYTSSGSVKRLWPCPHSPHAPGGGAHHPIPNIVWAPLQLLLRGRHGDSPPPVADRSCQPRNLRWPSSSPCPSPYFS